MHNQQFLDEGRTQIETQIRAMPRQFLADAFCADFERNYPALYEQFVGMYTSRGHDRPHAIQSVHAQLMSTVNTCFGHLTHKVATVQNPKGGDMSAWERVD